MSPRRSRKKSKRGGFLLRWWPFLLALVATPFLARSASVMALTGPSALRALYPFVLLVQTHATTLTPEQRDSVAQGVLWAQFPIYGLLVVFLSRWRGVFGSLLLIALLHGAAVLAAIYLR